MGRSSIGVDQSGNAGPVAGGYTVLTLTPFAATATPGATTSTFRIPIDFKGRLCEVGFATQSSAGGASRPTVQITDGTDNLFSGSVTLVSAGGVRVTPTSSPSLVAAERNRAKGDILQMAITTVATEAVAGLVVSLTFYVQGHVVASENDD